MGAACSSEEHEEGVETVQVAEEQKQKEREAEAIEQQKREEQERLFEEQKRLKEEADKKRAEEAVELRRQKELKENLLKQEEEQRKLREEQERARLEAEAEKQRAETEKRKEEEAIALEEEKKRKETEARQQKEKLQMSQWLRKHKFITGKVNEKLITRTVPSKKFSYPLHFAVKENNHEMVRILLENEADLHVKNSRSFTPLEKAKQKNHNKSHEKVVQQLNRRLAQGAAAWGYEVIQELKSRGWGWLTAPFR